MRRRRYGRASARSRDHRGDHPRRGCGVPGSSFRLTGARGQAWFVRGPARRPSECGPEPRTTFNRLLLQSLPTRRGRQDQRRGVSAERGGRRPQNPTEGAVRLRTPLAPRTPREPVKGRVRLGTPTVLPLGPSSAAVGAAWAGIEVNRWRLGMPSWPRARRCSRWGRGRRLARRDLWRGQCAHSRCSWPAAWRCGCGA